MTSTDSLFTTPLSHRALLAVGGEERANFLHGLLSCAIKDLEAGQTAWGALLTAQGKFLHDVFVTVGPDEILLEGEAERMDDLFKRLKRYRLRSKVSLDIRTDWTVHALWEAPGCISNLPALGLPGLAASVADDDRVIASDPRTDGAGWRIYAKPGASALPDSLPAAAVALADWDRHRFALALPDGARDMAVEGATLLENGFSELKGVDFKKGCFVGQEVTARMRYRGLVKKRLLPVLLESAAPVPPGTRLKTAAGVEAGELMSSIPADENGPAMGLALMRLAQRNDGPFTVNDLPGQATLAPIPAWVVLPKEAEDA